MSVTRYTVTIKCPLQSDLLRRGAGGGIQEDEKAEYIVGAVKNDLMQFDNFIWFIAVLKTP